MDRILTPRQLLIALAEGETLRAIPQGFLLRFADDNTLEWFTDNKWSRSVLTIKWCLDNELEVYEPPKKLSDKFRERYDHIRLINCINLSSPHFLDFDGVYNWLKKQEDEND